MSQNIFFVHQSMSKVSELIKEKSIGFVFNLVSLIVIVTILLLVIYVFAAFVEPSSAPSASNQDFAQNILGADNANNSFASTNVASNVDGSIIERLEHLWANRTSFGTPSVPRGPVIAMSAESALAYSNNLAPKYCYDLSATAAVAMDGDTITTYTDWRFPTSGELAVFIGTVTDSSQVWTATPYEATSNYYIKLNVYESYWSGDANTSSNYVRCVR